MTAVQWWVKGSGASQKLEKSAASPGTGWVLIPGSTASMTEKQAVDLLVTDAAGGAFGSSPVNGIKKIAQAAGVGNPLKTVDQFLGQLSSANTWIRVGKVVLGGALLLIGLAKITGVDGQVKSVGKIVSKAPLL
jgi:2-keto-4-pentenoate hydratase